MDESSEGSKGLLEENERIGVWVGDCNLKVNEIFCRPVVSVELVDSNTGKRFVTTSSCTQPLSTYKTRLDSPFWDETVTIDYAFKIISNRDNHNYLLLFEITDDVLETSSLFRTKRKDIVKMRLAWAFLKPVASNGELNLERELRLQLFKIGKNCLKPHHSCPIFHLYADHKRKKYPGSLLICIKPVQPVPPAIASPAAPSAEIEVETPADRPPPAKITLEWSRLPTQSCKIPNSRYADLAVNRRGCSSLAFSPSGKFLACGSFNKIAITNVLERKITARLVGHSGLVYEIAWSSNETYLLSVSADCSAMVWNMNPVNKTPMFVLPHPSFVYCGKWLTSGRLMTGGKDGKIRYWWETKSGFELLEELPSLGGFVSALEILGDSAMFSGDSNGVVTLWNLQESGWIPLRKITIRASVGLPIDMIQLHSGEKRLAVTTRGRGSVMLDIATGAHLQTFESDVTSRCIPSLSPCGSLFFAYGSQNTVNVWDFEIGRLMATYQSVFPVNGEMSGFIAYHPWDHLVAFAVLGDSYPVVILKFSATKDESKKLGLVYHITEKTDSSVKLQSKRSNPENSTGAAVEDRLAAIVRNMDRVLAAKKEMTARLSSSNLRKEKF